MMVYGYLRVSRRVGILIECDVLIFPNLTSVKLGKNGRLINAQKT